MWIKLFFERFFWPHILNILSYWFFFLFLPATRHFIVQKMQSTLNAWHEKRGLETLNLTILAQPMYRDYPCTQGPEVLLSPRTCSATNLPPWPRPQQDIAAWLNQPSWTDAHTWAQFSHVWLGFGPSFCIFSMAALHNLYSFSTIYFSFPTHNPTLIYFLNNYSQRLLDSA